MSSTTPYLGLTLYDNSTDLTVTFSTFRAQWGGPSTGSNFYLIDTELSDLNDRVTTLESQRGAIPVDAGYVSANYYEATVSAITSYDTGMTILVNVDTTSNGTVTLNISSLGTKSLMKVNSSGTPINLTGSDLVVGRQYLFMYDGTRWLWVSANSADQIQIVGTAGDVVVIGSSNNLETSSFSPVRYGQDGFADNYSIVPSVSSNNLTIAIKGADGNNLSSTNPAFFTIDGGRHAVTTAISFTKNAGTAYGNADTLSLASQDIDWFVYVILETGASAGTKFGFSRAPYALTMGDLSSTATDQDAILGNYTNFNSTDKVEVIGRFRAQLDSSDNWSIPNAKVINRPIRRTDILSFTVTMGNITVGNGTIVGYYQITESSLKIYSEFTFGSTSAISGAHTVATPYDTSFIATFRANVRLILGSTNYIGIANVASGNIYIFAQAISSSYLASSPLSSTVPATWTTGDVIRCMVELPLP